MDESVPMREGLRLLVVDDSVTDLALLARLVERVAPEGSKVDREATGEAALLRLRERHYDAIVADVHLDGLSGIDVCAEAKRLQPHAIRILVTSDQDLSTLQQALSRTALDAYFLKRWGEERMAAQLGRFLSGTGMA